MVRIVTNFTATVVLLVLSIPAFAADSDRDSTVRDITGVWTSEELGFELEIYGCGNANLCGRVVSYSESARENDLAAAPQRKKTVGDQRIVGRELLSGFEADQENNAKWSNGRIFNPQDGRTYKSTLTLDDEDTLRLRAYVGRPFFGRNLTLKRAQQYSPAGGG